MFTTVMQVYQESAKHRFDGTVGLSVAVGRPAVAAPGSKGPGARTEYRPGGKAGRPAVAGRSAATVLGPKGPDARMKHRFARKKGRTATAWRIPFFRKLLRKVIEPKPCPPIVPKPKGPFLALTKGLPKGLKGKLLFCGYKECAFWFKGHSTFMLAKGEARKHPFFLPMQRFHRIKKGAFSHRDALGEGKRPEFFLRVPLPKVGKIDLGLSLYKALPRILRSTNSRWPSSGRPVSKVPFVKSFVRDFSRKPAAFKALLGPRNREKLRTFSVAKVKVDKKSEKASQLVRILGELLMAAQEEKKRSGR